MGVGGDDSWSKAALPHEEFRIKPYNYSYSFIIKAIDNSTITERIALPNSNKNSKN